MDGLEWKRKKYNWYTRQFLKKAEAWAAKNAEILVADNPAIKKYLEEKYGREAAYIPYPVHIPVINEEKAAQTLKANSLEPYRYYLAIARMEPENNLEMIIEGVLATTSSLPLLIIGNPSNKYGRWLVKKYQSNRVRFPGAIYDKGVLDDLRSFSAIYFHGHSVGGTNPSLLEAMACGSRILAHGNAFNREVLKGEGEYFLKPRDISDVLGKEEFRERRVIYDLSEYEIEKIVSEYMGVFGFPRRHGGNTEHTKKYI
jgi:glycosyltransferase involved in cell wall biosynthesis